MHLFIKVVRMFGVSLFIGILSYSNVISAASLTRLLSDENGKLAELQFVEVPGYGLYNAKFSNTYQGTTHDEQFVQAAGNVALGLFTGTGVLQGGQLDFLPHYTRGCENTVFCTWLTVVREEPALRTLDTMVLAAGAFGNFNKEFDQNDQIGPTLITDPISKIGDIFPQFGFLNDENTTYLDWTPTTAPVPVPAALFMFAPALLGLMGYRRKLAK